MTDDHRNALPKFSSDAERLRAIAAQLSERPVEEVLGFTGEGSRSGGYLRDGRRRLVIVFDGWRTPPGPLKSEPLRVEYICTPDQFESLWARITDYTVFRIRARVVEKSVIGTPQAELMEFLGPDTCDVELNGFAIDLQKPVVVKDRQFGKLSFDRWGRRFTTKSKWNGRSIELNLMSEGPESLEGALTSARELWRDQAHWTDRIVDFAVQKLRPVKNASWLDEDAHEAEWTDQAFRSKMKLDSITVNKDRSFEFWYSDGGMFSGHWIQVEGDLDAGPTRADIPG